MHRYLNVADEPDPADRLITFEVSDGVAITSDSLTLQLVVVDDNPTMVIHNNSAQLK